MYVINIYLHQKPLLQLCFINVEIIKHKAPISEINTGKCQAYTDLYLRYGDLGFELRFLLLFLIF